MSMASGTGIRQPAPFSVQLYVINPSSSNIHPLHSIQQEFPDAFMRLLELRHVWRYAECRTGCCNLGNEVFKGSCSSFVSPCLPCALVALFSHV